MGNAKGQVVVIACKWFRFFSRWIVNAIEHIVGAAQCVGSELPLLSLISGNRKCDCAILNQDDLAKVA